MNIEAPLQLLGGISPQTFMKRYWQRKPLLIRQAIPGFAPLLQRAELLDLAAQDEVESRLIVREPGGKWKLKHGPFGRKNLPPFKQGGWTLLVQGVDLHDERVHGLMNQFRFVPDVRLDDVMISYATDQGGVGPHFDSYDVFLLQAHGRRRWRIGKQKDLTLQAEMPLKILDHFEPEQEFVLEPGDMLYLPPKYAHDGVAEGECMTYSVGFRSPSRGEIASEVLQRLAEHAIEELPSAIYADPHQSAVETSAALPDSMLEFAQVALKTALRDPKVVSRTLGESLSEPKPNIWFEGDRAVGSISGDVRLDRRTRMLYDTYHIFINGESFIAAGRDAQIIRRLADQRNLSAQEVGRLSLSALELLREWCANGWLHVDQ